MKPIELKLKNFGPFIDETIRFDELAEQKLFLISGRTGSGKTILFDAMTYALYGEASTKDRDKNSLRSQFAKEEEISSVVFTFTVNGSVYQAERQLPYRKPGNKNMTDTKFQLYDITDDKKLLAVKPSEGRQAVLDILKVDANQFRQILILPQGEFKRFLVSSSREKQPVLRTLFGTDRFKKLEDQLLTETKEIEAAVHKDEEKLYTLLEQFKTEELLEGSIETQLEQVHIDMDGQKKELERLIEQISILNKEISKRQSELDDSRQVNSWIKEAQHLREEQQLLVSQKPSIDEKEIKLKQLQVLGSLLQDKERIDKLKLKINQWTSEQERLTRNSVALTEELQQENNKLELLNDKDGMMQDLIQARDQQRHFLNAEEWQGIAQKIQDDEEQVKQLTSQLAEDKETDTEKILTQLRQNSVKREQLADDIQILTMNIKQLEIELKEQEQHNQQVAMKQGYETEFAALPAISENAFAEQIYDLRAHLHDGDRCPVCQQSVDKVPDQLDYDKIKADRVAAEEVNRQKIRLESLIEQIGDIKHVELESLYNQLAELEAQLKLKKTEKKNADKLQKQLDQDYEAAKENQQVFEAIKEKLHSIKMELKHTKTRYDKFKAETGYEEYETFKENWHRKDDEITDYQKSVSLSEKMIADTRHALELIQSESTQLSVIINDNKSELEESQRKLENQLSIHHITVTQLEEDSSHEQIEELEAVIKQYQESLSHIKLTLDHLDKLINNRSSVDIEILEAVLDENQQQLQLHVTRETTLQIRYNDHKKLLQQVSELFDQYKGQVEEQKELLTLSRLLGGKNQHNLTLENYVLTYYLDQTLILSNLRLSEMTHHRYQFRRKAEKSLGYSGLDIEIFDNYSNQLRDITTLSGGETFLASLSLALGLSDYVTQLAGGISLESVFIDEGFGTLDNETLETAIECLMELERSGKMVGMISHVALLKDRIPAILHVESAGYLSTTRFSIK